MYVLKRFKCLHTLYVNMQEKMQISLEGYAVIDKVAKKSGRGTGIYLPREWDKKTVRVILLEPANEEVAQ